ncbi:putative lost on transformation protein 1 [Danaus plexippus plexippus]|uniref:Lost on transformation protein 1 n=1 Tax=Danaus plexippus plexippus TaxID=278856 RepID=A0A212FAB1_DANPL|nr:putative lost on transformation protein 1 [Danaus plexippus plexippus]
MASPPPNPRAGAESGSQFTEETGGPRAAAPQKKFIAPPASQLPTKLEYVARGGTGRSVKHTFRTVKFARRVPTLPPKKPEGGAGGAGEASGSGASAERRPRRDRSKRHVCTTCDKRFSSPGKLSQHVLSHTGELPFSCDLCDKRFNSKFKLVRHSLIHSESRAFACTVCAEEGNLQCKICDEVFNSRQEIVNHLKVHTGSRAPKSDTDKKFTCDHCDRRFFTAKDVRRHLVVHTGRRDFLCPHCPQKFGRKDHLVRHVKNAHPEESWKSAAVGTSKDPPPEATSFEETYTEYNIEETDFNLWKTITPKEEVPEGRTEVPASDIIVEIPDLGIKVEPLDIKLENPQSPSEILEYPVVYMTDLPYITQPIRDPIDVHLLSSGNVQSILLDPGEGPSGLSSQMLGLLEEGEPSYPSDEGRVQQRLPAFTQAFQTAQSPKPPPPPPPPH